MLILQTMARCVYLYLGDSISLISRSSTFDLALHFDSVSPNNYFSSNFQHRITSNFCAACFFPTTDYSPYFHFWWFPIFIAITLMLQTTSLLLDPFHFRASLQLVYLLRSPSITCIHCSFIQFYYALTPNHWLTQTIAILIILRSSSLLNSNLVC